MEFSDCFNPWLPLVFASASPEGQPPPEDNLFDLLLSSCLVWSEIPEIRNWSQVTPLFVGGLSKNWECSDQKVKMPHRLQEATRVWPGQSFCQHRETRFRDLIFLWLQYTTYYNKPEKNHNMKTQGTGMGKQRQSWWQVKIAIIFHA